MTVNNEGGVPHVWTGLCPAGCAVVLRHKENLADLTGKARIKWYTKTSGFHEIRPIVKLANGDWLVGDHADRYTYDFHETEFYLADVRWLKLDIAKVQTKGTLLDKVDLSKVDEIGFVDLTPGSGHGLGAPRTSVGWRSMASRSGATSRSRNRFGYCFLRHVRSTRPRNSSARTIANRASCTLLQIRPDMNVRVERWLRRAPIYQ